MRQPRVPLLERPQSCQSRLARVVISRSAETPGTLRQRRLSFIKGLTETVSLTSRIFALPCVIRNDADLAPGKLIASTPRSASAIQSRDMDTRSPVVSNMSISRPGCTVDTSFASSANCRSTYPSLRRQRRRLHHAVGCTQHGRLPHACGQDQHEVPPYFWTMSVTRSTAYGCHEPSATVSETTSNSRSDAPVATGCSDFASPDPSSVWVSRCW